MIIWENKVYQDLEHLREKLEEEASELFLNAFGPFAYVDGKACIVRFKATIDYGEDEEWDENAKEIEAQMKEEIEQGEKEAADALVDLFFNLGRR